MASSSSRRPKSEGGSTSESKMKDDLLSSDDDNQNDVSFLKAKCSLLQNQLAFVRSQQKQRKDQRKKEKGEIVSTFKSMKTYIDQLEAENKQLSSLVSSKGGGTEGTDDTLDAEMKENMAMLEKENAALRSKQTQLESKCQELTLQCSSLTQEVSDRKDTEAQLRVKVEEYEQVVDRVPERKQKAILDRHVSTSVLADASIAGSSGDQDESTALGYAGEDEIKEDLFGKVVDHTPTMGRNSVSTRASGTKSATSSVVSFSRQNEDDTVFGVAEKAELASIQDVDGEDDSDIDDDDNSAVEKWEGSVAAGDNISLRLDVGDSKNLVDHVPALRSTPKIMRRKMDSSVVALADASIVSKGDTIVMEGGEDESGMFGKMVDFTPGFSPIPLNRTPSSVSFSNTHEDDTVHGVTERMEVESVMKQDEEIGGELYSQDSEYADDDGASRATRDAASVAGTIGSLRLGVIEEKNLVDHVPQERRTRAKQGDTSILAIADASTSSTPIDDTITGDSGNVAFGPMVDHTPSVVPMSAKSVATSVATQNSVASDFNAETGMDDTIGPGSTIGDADWDEGEIALKEENHLVDHVPKRRANRNAIDGSIRVVFDATDNMSQVDTIAEDQEMEFGPIVDHLPFSATRSVASTRSMGPSVANSTRALVGDMRIDDDLDSVPGNIATADTIEEEDDEVEEAEGSHLVDHVPTRQQSGNLLIDSSIRVVVDASDNLSESGNITGEERTDFGPIVDHTPFSTRSAARSVAASTAAVADDDSTTVQDNTVVTELSMGMGEVKMVPLAGGSDEKHLVDHVPSQASHPIIDGSIQVLVDTNETLSQGDATAEEGAMAFGPIVDHTPAVASTRSVARSVAASMMTMGSHDSDSTSIQDNTTVGFGAGASSVGGDDLDGPEDNLVPGFDQPAIEEKNLVDHVPQMLSHHPKPADMSILVQPEQLDAVSEVDDENSAGIVRAEKFCPIVDHTPAPPQSSSAQSVAMSMLTTASDMAADIREDDEMDSTWYSDGSSRRRNEPGDEEGTPNVSGDDGTKEVEKEDQPEITPEDSEPSSSRGIMVETVHSYSDDDMDEAYVCVDEPEQNSDEVTEATKDGDNGKEPDAFNLQEMKDFAEGLAAKTTNSNTPNPFVEAGEASVPKENVKEEVQDYIAQLASITAMRDSDSDQVQPDNRKIEEMQKYIAELASGAESVTGSNADHHSNSAHSAEDMQKYVADLASFTGIQTSSEATGNTEVYLPKSDTPTSKESEVNDDARDVILDEIGGPKRSSVFGKLFGGGKKANDKKAAKKGGTWA